MKIVIIEDERLVAISLKQLLGELVPAATIEGPLASVQEAVEYFRKTNDTELILSDIQLSDGIAFDIFTSVQINCPIIFTTAYNEYAIRAFKLNSIDYLLKPIEKAELASALQKFYLLQSKYGNYDYLKQIMELFGDFRNSKRYKERFAVNIGKSVTLIPVEEIAMFLKEELIYLVNKDGRRFITDYRSLDEVQELVDPSLFYRANRQNLVHLPFIESYRTDDTFKITLKMRALKSPDIIISKEKAGEFRRWFE